MSSLVYFKEGEIKPWSYDVPSKEPTVRMKNLTGVLENFGLNIGLNPHSKEKIPLNKLVEEKSDHVTYVPIPQGLDINLEADLDVDESEGDPVDPDNELEEGFIEEQPEGLRRPREMAQILEQQRRQALL